MACGYAHSVLGDFHLAEDAAQEAFIEAYRTLDKLREPVAFPGWFRRVVFKHCDRLTRRKQIPTASLETVGQVPAGTPDPGTAAEEREMQDKVLDAIRALPEHERTATTLFYINGYKQNEIADFLEVPVSTVKNRLHSSRKRLKERMMGMVSETLKGRAPDERFSQGVIAELLGKPRPLEIEGHPVREILDTIRAALPDYEYIEGDEVVEKRDEAGVYESGEDAYHLDDRRVLRTCTTITTVRAATDCTPPVRLITAGRVFRPDVDGVGEDAIRLKAFHTLDLIAIGEDIDEKAMKNTLARVVAAVLGEVDMRWEPHTYACFTEGAELSVCVEDKWTSIAGSGMLEPDRLDAAGFDPDSVSAFAFGIGLERLAMLKYGLDNIRALWEPPFIR
jgi:RNA polymerase sigma factor (sigma-70 family)